MDGSLGERIGEFLKCHYTMTVATLGPEGPWSAAVFYVNDGLDLWWLSKPTARHSTNLEFDPRASITIQADYRGPGAVRGMQMEGAVSAPVFPAGSASVMRKYLAKFPPAGRESLPLVTAIASFSSSRLYRFVPRRAYLIDSSRGFGHREEYPITAGMTTGVGSLVAS